MHIYKITNTKNNKVYIGQTIQTNPKMRWYAHLADARRGKKSYLLDSIRKYGKAFFVWEIIDVANTLDDLNAKEKQWVQYYRTEGVVVYNNREAGGNKTHSPESIEKMKAAQKLRHATTKVGGWKRQDGGAMKGKAHPGKGKTHTNRWTDEMKLAHSIRCKKREEKKRLLGQGE